MLLSFDEIETNHGWVPLVATITGVPGEHAAKTDEEGEIQRKGMNKRRMIETAAVERELARLVAQPQAEVRVQALAPALVRALARWPASLPIAIFVWKKGPPSKCGSTTISSALALTRALRIGSSVNS